MQNYSSTQASNLVSIVGFLAIILNHFKINITSEELQAAIGAGMILGGIVWNWINRYRSGDLTLLGIRK